LAHGLGLAIVAASIASFRQPDRAAGVMTMAASLAGTIMMFAIPQAQATFGVSSIFWVMGALILPPLIFIRALPRRAEIGDGVTTSAAPTQSASLLRPLVLISLLVAGFFYLSVGAFGPFSAQLGRNAGLLYQQTGEVLALAGVASMLGAVTAITVGDRFGRVAPILLSIIGASTALSALLIAPQSKAAFLLAVPAFFFCWASVYPYLMGFASRLDPSGRVNGLFFTLSLAGFAAGPAIGGMLTSFASTTQQGLAYVVLFSLICLIPALGFAPIVKTRDKSPPPP
jgi:predicted MFS family arabinose efflux permease